MLLNRIQCIRDFISSLRDRIEELETRRDICCSSVNSVLDENEEIILDENEINIIF